MTDISVRAEKNGTVYNVPIRIGMDFFDAKFDTGSSTTVIAASVFYDGWSDAELKNLEDFCESKGCTKREFTSASGPFSYAFSPLIYSDYVNRPVMAVWIRKRRDRHVLHIPIYNAHN